MLPLALVLLACSDPATDAAQPEPLALPADAGARGVPVGVRTFTEGAATYEIWYPAPNALADTPTDLADFDAFIPQAFRDHVGAFAFPAVDGRAVRDAALRLPEVPYPAVVFSHGFGGMRIQSLDYVTHLASRGYVVIATDHAGRSMPDLLPCMFSPPLEGCDLSGFGGEDPGVPGILGALDWLSRANAGDVSDAAFLAGSVDLAHVGLTGHSAGGGTTAEAGALDTRFTALLPMAAPAVADRDVPQLVMSATCDAIVTDTDIAAAVATRPGTPFLRVQGAGHLAFSDLCSLGLADLADQVLAPRDDLNGRLYEGLLQLATDGCPGAAPAPALACGDAFLPIEEGYAPVRTYATRFFDAALRGTGEGVTAGTVGAGEVTF